MKSIGYKVLNKNSGGAIGGSNTKWTEDKIIENFIFFLKKPVYCS
jgi:hypothetical protein